MTRPERILRFLLRLYALVTGCAVFAVFLPRPWMAELHALFLKGEALPDGAIVEYLARSLSAFYAMFGVLLWIVASDVRRYRPIILFAVWAGIAFGILITVIDIRLAFPWTWTLSEGPSAIAGSLLIAVFLRHVPTDPVTR